MNILYLGLDPKNFVCEGNLIHYPVIRIAPLQGPDFTSAVELWPSFTHVIFTSQSAVLHWDLDLAGKSILAIGAATAASIRKRGVEPLVASSATQEGVIQLLETLDLNCAHLFLPRSKKARSCLTDYLSQKQIPFFALDLYEPMFQKLEPVPNLKEVDEIVFTSPSTVEAFFQIYEAIPAHIKVRAIGPITEEFYRKNKLLH
jgi:uroporphyrinogen-III synthase